MASILIVDKDFSRYHAVKLTLAETVPEAAILYAPSGSFALKLLHELTLDMIALDLALPDISGLELCGKIKNSAKFQQIKIVAYANDRAYAMVGAVFKAGADYYLPRDGSDNQKLAALIANVWRLQPDYACSTRRPSTDHILLVS
ncbi:response regulator [Candidatus Chlorohelix sp.]|uniref:response regulator n=1 Tax=Candidatus Chlorohelix sp. TaxID=3139201 RepID=UPI0030221A5B